MQECSNKIVSFKYFRSLYFVSSNIWVGPCVEHSVFGKNCGSMFYSSVPFDFNFAMTSMSTGRSTLTYEECSNLSIFSRLGPFSQVFGQVKEWDMLELHEMIRVSYLVACPMVFNLLCDLSRQGGVLKLTKKVQF